MALLDVARGVEGDRSTPGPRGDRVRAHRHGCPACREDYESLRDFVAGTPPPPRGNDG